MPEYCSNDTRYGLIIEEAYLQKAIAICRNAQQHETGGIVIGQYTDQHNCAVITELIGPTKDSRSGRTWFERGTRGLQKITNQHWKEKKEYYLGEWHFHPFSLPNPSNQDLTQMKNIALSSSCNCPEPILLIIGGNPNKEVFLRVFVFPKGELIELFLTTSEYLTI